MLFRNSNNLFKFNDMSPFIIPIFISHQGCPHQCVFCNQHSITGQVNRQKQRVTPETVTKEIIERLSWPRRNSNSDVQVAFYGGSFTGLDKDIQRKLLTAVRPFIEDGKVKLIRISTRPDYISQKIVDFLQENNVGIVELGIQSMDNVVLEYCERGHTVEQVVEAFSLLKSKEVTVGAQLMTGLPGETQKDLLSGARRLAEMQPDFIRIYPTVVVKGSKLAELYAGGKYKPLSLEQAVVNTCKIKKIFDHYDIPTIRMGLQPSPALENDVLAGPFHPAFGELVLSRILFRKTRKLLSNLRGRSGRKLSIAVADQSIFRGQGNANWNRLANLGLLNNIDIVFDSKQPRQTVYFMES